MLDFLTFFSLKLYSKISLQLGRMVEVSTG